MIEKYCLMTNDVETTSIFYNCLSDETGEKVLKEGMPVLLDFYEKYNIKSTFFFTGYIAEKFTEVVKMIIPFGHEIGCHGFSHSPNDAFDNLNLEKQIIHLKKSKQILEDISGHEVISFRAPALRVNEFTHSALVKSDFKIDSSIASQRFDFFLSFGGIKKLKWLLTPRHPYITKEKNLYKKGKSSIVEVPLSALILPYMGTTLRIMPSITRLLRYYLHLEKKLIGNPIVFVIHPNELIEENAKTRKIARRKKNFISYFWSDFCRAKLKIKNIGKKAIPLLEREIDFFYKKNYQFLTIKDYCKKTGLLK
jgi:peptidoglycan/xylan/chitin deacetylase (PgdA/CDA1 family)